MAFMSRRPAPVEAPDLHPALGVQFHSPMAREAHNQAYWGAAANGQGYFQHPSGRSQLMAAGNAYGAQMRGARARY